MEEKRGFLQYLNVDKLIENISKYIEARIELAKVDVQQQVTGVIVKGVQLALMSVLGLFILAFASAGLANYLNEVIGNSFAGDLIVAGFYLLLFLAVKASKRPIQSKMEQVTGNMFVSNKEDEKHAEVVETAKEVIDENALGRPVQPH